MIDQQTAFADRDLEEKYLFVFFQDSFQGSDVGAPTDHHGVDGPRRQPENPIPLLAGLEDDERPNAGRIEILGEKNLYLPWIVVEDFLLQFRERLDEIFLLFESAGLERVEESNQGLPCGPWA
jgi:hypothetical protein